MPPEAFAQTLDRHFPNALPEPEFVARTTGHLGSLGFTPQNTLAAVAVCRDEIAASMIRAVDASWGPPFIFASLGGLPTAGRTGFAAAAQHIPRISGTQRFVFYAMAHIAIGSDGTAGSVQRAGLPGRSVACGALVALRNELIDGEAEPVLDPVDVEQSYLRWRLLPMLQPGNVPDLVALTRLTAEAIELDSARILQVLAEQAEATSGSLTTEVGFLTGIQVHGPDGVTYVAPRWGRLHLGGQQRDIDWSSLRRG